MPKHDWSTRLNSVHAESLPLLITSLFSVQILSALRDPIVIGWELPFWLVALGVLLILVNLGLLIWIRRSSFPESLSYPVAAAAYICTGFKAVGSIVAQAEALPFYVAVVMLAGSLCFLSMRYLVLSMAAIFLAWLAVAPRILSVGEIISTVLVTGIGAAIGIYLLRRRIAAFVQVFELEQRVVTLESILPMCANCKKTRDHAGNWQSIEDYIEDNQDGTQISHGSCPSCTEELYGDYLKNRKESAKAS